MPFGSFFTQVMLQCGVYSGPYIVLVIVIDSTGYCPNVVVFESLSLGTTFKNVGGSSI